MANAATHYGHCQACGSRQKLPAGVLAKHGYTTRWGFFSGTCPGSGYRPFETHTDLILKFSQDAARDGAALAGQAQALRVTATSPRAWHHQYVAATWQVRRSSYRWVEVDLLVDGLGHVAFTLDGKTQTASRCGYGYGGDVLTVATTMNANKANALDVDAAKRFEYVAWQRDRIAAWTPQPLEAVA